MAKQLDWVSMTIGGTSTGPGSGNSATFAYLVTDTVDTAMRKTGTFIPNPPVYTDTVNKVWTDAVAAIKTNEGIP